MSRIIKLRADALEWREVEGEIVALDLRSSTYFSVNKTGAAIWPELSNGATREELVTALSKRYSIGAEPAARDVDAFVASLEAEGFLEAT